MLTKSIILFKSTLCQAPKYIAKGQVLAGKKERLFLSRRSFILEMVVVVNGGTRAAVDEFGVPISFLVSRNEHLLPKDKLEDWKLQIGCNEKPSFGETATEGIGKETSLENINTKS